MAMMDSEGTPVSVGADGREYVLMLVEDSPADVRLAQEVFRDAGFRHRLHVARDGEQALRMLRREGEHARLPLPDLVLLDLNLPRRDGREVLREVKGDPRLRQIPVLILSTSKAERDVVECYQSHANAYLVKPVDLEEFERLASMIRDCWLGMIQLPPRME